MSINRALRMKGERDQEVDAKCLNVSNHAHLFTRQMGNLFQRAEAEETLRLWKEMRSYG